QSWSLGDADKIMMDQLAVLLENQLGFSVFEAIEAAKRDLSLKEKTEIIFNYPGIKIKEPVTRKQFKSDSQDEVKKIFGALDDTLLRAGITAAQVDRICCTGGTAKALVVREQLVARFDEKRLENFRNFTSIVEGLSERAQQLLK
ncbi:MAG: Hsp70 family protein, partial [Bdellovibrionota bacterium]